MCIWRLSPGCCVKDKPWDSASEARWPAVAIAQVRGDAGLDTDVRDGDGKNRTDLGYVLEAEWAGRDDTQDVGGAIEKRKKRGVC